MLKPYIEQPKKEFPYDRPLSWSQISSFHYNPRQWYSKYVLGEEQPTSLEMEFGKNFGEKLATDSTFRPDIERALIFEQELRTKLDDMELLGFLDGFDPDKKVILEYKTSRNKKRWTDKSVQTHGQLDFYSFLVYQNYKIKPEDLTIKLIYIPTHINDGQIELSGEEVKSFEVKKTMVDILVFANFIKETRKKMIEFYEKQ